MSESLNQLLLAIGIEASQDALLSIVCLLAFALGAIIAKTVAQRQMNKLRLAHESAHEKEQLAFDEQLDQLSHTFSSLSQQALKSNNESFLQLASQSFSQLQQGASNELKSREQSFSNLLQPIKQSIEQTDKQLRQLDQDRRVSETKLGEQIGNLLSSQASLQSETRNLVTALRRPEVRGQWGELTLKRIVELAGMSEYCDFDTQVSVNTSEGMLRPDMLIRLPSERILVLDVKTPLDAYLSASEASDPGKQNEFLQQHYRNVKQRIKELSAKQYWQQFDRSPDFVILFIPGDQFLSAALDQDKNLLEYALKNRILLATPTSLVGLLRAVAYGWNQDSLSKNADEIREIGETLYLRLQKLTEHFNSLGRNLDQSIEQFNKLAGSYSRSTLPAAKRLSDLGISTVSPIDLSNTKGNPTRTLDER
ncbi:MAG: DNA recombination protein RmuC [Cryomorphaceae bacterium]|jgi:DNA recombination protein RmuC